MGKEESIFGTWIISLHLLQYQPHHHIHSTHILYLRLPSQAFGVVDRRVQTL